MRLLTFFVCSYSAIAFSQGGRLVMTGASYLTIDNQAKLVIERGTFNSIVNSGTGGIITESEFDQVVWFIGNNTGSYVIPFVSQGTLAQIPLTTDISISGTGSGKILFSTYPGATWDNNNYRPSDVTHMGSLSSGLNNSDNVIDRFWIIDAQGYTTKPNVNLGFTYQDIEHLQAGNTVVEANLGAQRFNTPTGQWGDYLPQGVTNTVTNKTINVPVSPANFFRSWTLSEIDQPLAVDVTVFRASCDNETPLFEWETLQEVNIDYFEIDYYNGAEYESIAIVEPSSSFGENHYSALSTSRKQGLFRLSEIDNDGLKTEKGSLYLSCSSFEEMITAVNGGVLIVFHSVAESIEPCTIYDMSGRLVFEQQVAVDKGENTLFIPTCSLSHGSYLVNFGSESNHLTGKLISY